MSRSPWRTLITITPKPEEPFETYLVRLLGEARRTRTSVGADFDGVTFVVTPTMTVSEARQAFITARERPDAL